MSNSRFFVEAPDTPFPHNESASANVPTACSSVSFSTSRPRTTAAPTRPPRARDPLKMSDKPITSSNSAQRKTPTSNNRREDVDAATEKVTGAGEVRDMTSECQDDATVSVEGVSKTESPQSRKGAAGRSPPVAPKPRSIKNRANPPTYTSSNTACLRNAKNTSPPCTSALHDSNVQPKSKDDFFVNGQPRVSISVTSTSSVYTSPIVLRRKPDSKSTIAELIGPSTSSFAFGKVSAGVEPSRKSLMSSPKMFRSSKIVKSFRRSKASPEQPEMPSVALSSDQCPPSLTDFPMGNARTQVAHELYTTEHTYVKGLEIVAQVFMPPLSTVLEGSEIDAIFANLESILAFNQELLYTLYVRLSTWSERTCIGDLFLNRIPRFRIYTLYCNNYDNAEETIALKSKKKKDFEAALNTCYADPRSHPGITLQAYLLTPVQRIPRYLLLLKELLDKTPTSHRDYATLKEAHDKMNELAEHVNNQIKEAQGKKTLTKLTTKVVGLHNIAEESGRMLIKEGPVNFMATRKLYQAILFSDLLVFAICADGKHCEVELALDLSTVWVEDLEDLDPATTQEDAIEIYTPDRPYTIYVKSRNEKKLWIQKLTETIMLHLNPSVKKDSPTGQSDIKSRVSSFTYKDGRHYVGHWSDSKRHGRGQMTWANKTCYKGEWEEDERSGEGETIYNTGEKYKGKWLGDKQNGYGELRYCNDDLYKGYWKNGVKHGEAVVEFANGDQFEGKFVDGSIEGDGVWQSRKTGAMYKGMWKGSQRHGKGIQVTTHGHEYKGEFKDNFMDGLGKMKYSDGSTYEGTWKVNQRNGEGVWVSKTGERYEGKWSADSPHIQGKMVYSNKNVYDGNWHFGKRDGIGKMQFANGDMYEGQFKSDQLTGKGLYQCASGSSYEGELVDGSRHGEGKMTYCDGSIYQGQWKANCREGEGEMTWPHGVVYQGNWKNDKPHGRGILINKLDMSRYDGNWENGQRHGHGIETSSKGKYDGQWQQGMRHGKGTECSLVGTTFEGTWQCNKKHGRGYRKLVSGVTDYQMWHHGRLGSENAENTAVDLPVISPMDFC